MQKKLIISRCNEYNERNMEGINRVTENWGLC